MNTHTHARTPSTLKGQSKISLIQRAVEKELIKVPSQTAGPHTHTHTHRKLDRGCMRGVPKRGEDEVWLDFFSVGLHFSYQFKYDFEPEK